MEDKVKKIISQEFIDELDTQIFSIDTKSAINDMDKFIISQQIIIKFIVNKISEYSPSIQEKANFINFFIWKAFEENLPEVPIKKLELVYQRNMAWFQKILTSSEKALLEVLKSEMIKIRQPYLLNWVLEELLQDTNTFNEAGFKVQVDLFVLFKTIIDIYDMEINDPYLK